MRLVFDVYERIILSTVYITLYDSLLEEREYSHTIGLAVLLYAETNVVLLVLLASI